MYSVCMCFFVYFILHTCIGRDHLFLSLQFPLILCYFCSKSVSVCLLICVKDVFFFSICVIWTNFCCHEARYIRFLVDIHAVESRAFSLKLLLLLLPLLPLHVNSGQFNVCLVSLFCFVFILFCCFITRPTH